MPKVICTRPNASLNINGVNFTPTEDGGGVISDEISTEEAELFLSIDGYHAAEEGEQKPSVVKPAAAPKAPATDPAADAAKAAADAERAALVARAEAIQFKVKANWSLERLKSEVESAEADAAKAKADAEAAAKAASGEQAQ